MTLFTEKCDLRRITKLNFAHRHSKSIGSLAFTFEVSKVSYFQFMIFGGEPNKSFSYTSEIWFSLGNLRTCVGFMRSEVNYVKRNSHVIVCLAYYLSDVPQTLPWKIIHGIRFMKCRLNMHSACKRNTFIFRNNLILHDETCSLARRKSLSWALIVNNMLEKRHEVVDLWFQRGDRRLRQWWHVLYIRYVRISHTGKVRKSGIIPSRAMRWFSQKSIQKPHPLCSPKHDLTIVVQDCLKRRREGKRKEGFWEKSERVQGKILRIDWIAQFSHGNTCRLAMICRSKLALW